MRESIPIAALLFMGWKVGNSHSTQSTILGYTLDARAFEVHGAPSRLAAKRQRFRSRGAELQWPLNFLEIAVDAE